MSRQMARYDHAAMADRLGVAPNQRLKLSARGGRSVGNRLFLCAAAAGRSLSAIR
jgi:hypothetical protein